VNYARDFSARGDTSPSGSAAAISTATPSNYIGIDTSIEADGGDRSSNTWPVAQLQLIGELGALGKRLINVQIGEGQVDGAALLQNSTVNAMLRIGYPGQEGRNAIYEIQIGSHSPTRRLPVTQYPTWNTITMLDMGLRPTSSLLERHTSGTTTLCCLLVTGYFLHGSPPHQPHSTSKLSSTKPPSLTRVYTPSPPPSQTSRTRESDIRLR
jgi:hypothetical protein